MAEDKIYDPKVMKAAIEDIDKLIPLLEKQVALYKEMKRGFEYKLEKQKAKS